MPDYELDDLQVVTDTGALKAMFHPVRGTLLDLVLERAATVGELATAVERPPSSIAYHVGVLLDVGMLKVVRTRRVRAVDERYYGRTARVFYVGAIRPEQRGTITNTLGAAAAESDAAHAADQLRAIHRHAQIPAEQAAEFWDDVLVVARRFSALQRRGDTTYAFVAGLYPADYPRLPDRA